MRRLLILFVLMLTPSVCFAQASVHTLAGVNAQTGTSYTIQAVDQTKLLTFNNANPVAVTLPSAVTTNFGVGAIFAIRNLGAGAVTITPASGTIDGGGSLVLSQGQGADIYSDGSNYVSQKGAGGGGIVGGMTPNQVPIAATATSIASSKPIQGTDTSILSSGFISGLAAPLCTDAPGGATTTGCPNISGATSGQVAIAGSPNTVTSSKAIQGTEVNLLSSDGSGSTASPYCRSASGGATTIGCPSGGGGPGGLNNDTQCNNTGSSFKACTNQPAILYVSTNGSDSNSGKTWDTAKLTIMAAVCALPGGNCSSSPKQTGSGTIIYQTGVSCNSNASAGCWIAGFGDSQYPNMTGAMGGPTAWETEPTFGTPLNFICATMDTIVATGNAPSCTVIGPSHTVGNVPLLWVTGNSLGNFYINGMTSQDGTGFAAQWGRIGIDSATGNIIGTPTVTQTVSFTIENSASDLTSGAQTAGWGPQLAIGNGFWMHLHDDIFGANNGESCQVSAISRTSNVTTVTTTGCQSGGASTCPFLVGDHLSIRDTTGDGTFNGTFTAATACGAGSTVTFNQTGPNFSGSVGSAGIISDDRAFAIVCYECQIEMARNHLNGAGMKFYTGSSANLQMDDVYMEGGGTLTQPILWTSALAFGSGGQADVSGLFIADTPLLPSVINEAGMLMFVRTEQSQSTPIRGSMILLSANDSFSRTTNLINAGQSGWYDNTHLEASTDIARRQAPISTAAFGNLAIQNSSFWTGSNFIIASGKRDPFGGVGALEIDATASTTALFYNVTQTVNIGDTWYFGAWVKAVNTGFSGGSPISFGLTTGGFGAGDTCSGGQAQIFTSTPFAGDGNWFWVTGFCTIFTNPSSAGVGFGAAADATHAIQVYRPFLFRITSGTASGNEISLELNSYSFGGSTSANPGDIVFPSDKKLCLPSGNSGVSNEFCGYFTHANTQNRTWAMPDASGIPLVNDGNTTLSSFDGFNRSAPLGSNWTNVTGLTGLTITGNQVVGGTASVHQAAAYTGNTTISNDQFSQAVIVSGGNNVNGAESVTCRNTTASGNFYSFQFYNGNFNLNKFVAGVPASLSSGGGNVAGTLNSNDVIRVECVGSTITGFQVTAGVKTQVVQGTDASYTTGPPGIDIFGNTSVSVMDNWSGGNIQPLIQQGTELDMVNAPIHAPAITSGVSNPIPGALPFGYLSVGAYTDFFQQPSSPPPNPPAGYCRGFFAFGGQMTFTNSAGTSCGPAGSGGGMVFPSTVGLTRWTGGAAWAASVNDTTALTGQPLVATNGLSSSFASPGIQDGNALAHVTTTPYSVLCDSPSALRDRGTTIIFDSGASVVNLPDHTLSGCGNNFALKMINNSGGNLTVNRGGSDTLDIYGLVGASSIAATSFTWAYNTWFVANNGEAARWNVTIGGNVPLPNVTTSTGTTAIAANTCTTATTVTMTGLATTQTIVFTPNVDVSGIAGWGSTGGLVIDTWPTANTVNYRVCNPTGSSITPGSSITWNVSAR